MRHNTHIRYTLSEGMGRFGRVFSLYSFWDILFFLSSGAFVLFWVLVVAMAQWKHLRLSGFGGNLTIALGVGILFYLAVVLLPRYGRIPTRLAQLMMIGAFLCSLLVPLALLTDTAEQIANATAYFSDTYADDIRIVQIVSATRFWGPGEPIPGWGNDLSALLALTKYDVFDYLLIMLAYLYGSWIGVVFGVIAAVWCISAVMIYRGLYSRWHEWIFLTCFITVAVLVIPPAVIILMGNGDANTDFCTLDWESMITLFSLPMAAMLAVIKQNNERR